jgi:hypothetical protein
MPSTATVTAKTGPGNTVTALVLNNVTDISLSPAPNSVLKVVSSNGTDYFDISASTTITATIASGVVSFTIS